MALKRKRETTSVNREEINPETEDTEQFQRKERRKEKDRERKRAAKERETPEEREERQRKDRDRKKRETKKQREDKRKKDREKKEEERGELHNTKHSYLHSRSVSPEEIDAIMLDDSLPNNAPSLMKKGAKQFLQSVFLTWRRCDCCGAYRRKDKLRKPKSEAAIGHHHLDPARAISSISVLQVPLFQTNNSTPLVFILS